MKNFYDISLAIFCGFLFISAITTFICTGLNKSDKPIRLWISATLILMAGSFLFFLGHNLNFDLLKRLGLALQITGLAFFYYGCCTVINGGFCLVMPYIVIALFGMGLTLIENHIYFQLYVGTSITIFISAVGIIRIGPSLFNYKHGGKFLLSVYILVLLFGILRISVQTFYGFDDPKYFQMISSYYLLGYCLTILLATVGIVQYSFQKNKYVA